MNDDAVVQNEERIENTSTIVEENMPSITSTTAAIINGAKRLSKSEKKVLKSQRLMEASKQKFKRYKERKKAEKQAKLLLEKSDNISNSNNNNNENNSNEDGIDNDTNQEYTPTFNINKKQLLEDKLQRQLECGINVCVELGYDKEVHNDRERSSLCKQLSVSYGYLKRTPALIHLHLASFNPESLYYPTLQKQGVDSWKVDKHPTSAVETFPKEKLVFLSPDAVDVLTDFDQEKVYVIGGIVDRTVKKNLTWSQAKTMGIQSYRLPIHEYIPQRVTHVLNVDHCVQIIGEYQLNKDWKQTLEAIVPKRKIFNKAKEENEQSTSQQLDNQQDGIEVMEEGDEHDRK